MQEARFSILHWARRDVVSTLYAESLILANARAAVISLMQPKIPSRMCSPDFPRLTNSADITHKHIQNKTCKDKYSLSLSLFSALLTDQSTRIYEQTNDVDFCVFIAFVIS